ncbi:MAG: hypothetical protein A2Y57_03225 [Candidatus Woykebacteria bacterium RBG_13_40_7b]|uniref:Uncharacterized protein n=1 Tax=Candidatus Woykebacteria bacterium RBG_13_40_7b TaxID=1802594 RepID=A0A1G1W634_9BACT|nr:MAG: hypothetical protein A2Y57_03225 [Candidatus Woykebacteria bacterium RBG_13_40_7b]
MGENGQGETIIKVLWREAGSLRSVGDLEHSWIARYEQDRVTRPPVADTGLFAFSSTSNARAFVKSLKIPRDGRLEIWEASGTGVRRRVRIATRYGLHTFWFRFNSDGCRFSRDYGLKAPRGTVLCESIRLVRPIQVA